VLLFTNLHSGTRHVQYTNLHGGTQPVHESFSILDTSTTTLAQACESDKYQYSMYFQRKGGRCVAHPPI